MLNDICSKSHYKDNKMFYIRHPLLGMEFANDVLKSAVIYCKIPTSKYRNTVYLYLEAEK